MKCFFIIAFACCAIASVQGLTKEQQEKVKGYFKECIGSTGADTESVHKSRKGEFVDDPKVADFVFCFFKKVGFMSEAGELQAEVVKAKVSGDLNEEQVKAVVGKCNGETGKTNSEKAYNIYKCYWNATPNHINLAS